MQDQYHDLINAIDKRKNWRGSCSNVSMIFFSIQGKRKTPRNAETPEDAIEANIQSVKNKLLHYYNKDEPPLQGE